MHAATDVKPLVIHIDDNEDILHLFRINFRIHFEIRSTTKIADIEEWVRNKNIDCVITDFEMKECNGFDVLRKVKELNPDLPVIFYTGQGNEDIARKAFVQGVSDYFVKDLGGFVHKQKIYNSICKAIEIRKSRNEKENAYKAYRESEQRYRLIAENINDALYIHDKFGNIIDVNDNTCKMLGYERHELVGANLESIQCEEARWFKKERMHELLNSGKLIFLGEDIHRDGLVIPVEISAKVISYEGDCAILSVVRDISDRLLVQETRMAAAEVMKAIPSGLVIYSYIEPDKLVVLDANPAALKMLGKNAEDLRGREFCELWPQLENSEMLANFHNVMRTSENYHVVYEYFQDEKLIIIIEAMAFKISDDKLGIAFLDVTQTRIVQEDLKRSREKYKILFDMSPDAIFIVSENAEFLDMNQVAVDRYGYSREELLKMRPWDLSPVYHHDFIVECVGKAMQGSVNLETVHLCKDGREIPVEIISRQVVLEGRRCSFAVVRDLSERKKTETMLSESMKIMSSIFHKSPDIIILSTIPEAVIVEANESLERLSGFSTFEVIGKTTKELNIWVHSDDRIRYLREFAEKGKIVNFESDFRHKNGTINRVLCSSEKVWVNGQPLMLSVIRDVTDIDKKMNSYRQPVLVEFH